MSKIINILMSINAKLCSLSCCALSIFGFIFICTNKLGFEEILLGLLFILIFSSGIMLWSFSNQLMFDE